MPPVLQNGEEGAGQVQEDARTSASVGPLPKRHPSLMPSEGARREARVHDMRKEDGQA